MAEPRSFQPTLKQEYSGTVPKHPQKSSHTAWSHLLAGISSGITTAILTSPLDVLRTRLQASVKSSLHGQSSTPEGLRNVLRNIIIADGWRGLFRGILPSITGVVPATAVKFFTYGNCKHIYSANQYLSKNPVALNAAAAATAGFATSTVTNPIWVIKTRLQLDDHKLRGRRQYHSSIDCVVQILRTEGVKGFYRGLSASYLGAVETTIHLVLYEHIKNSSRPRMFESSSIAEVTGAAGLSKLVATLIAYPHEVIRTRLRQAPMADGTLRYTGIMQCARLTYHEGFRAFYGGLVPHMLRSLPSAAISLGMYELVLSVL